ncbi:hypothetical protein X777_08341, partial [Ooceraea biroi]
NEREEKRERDERHEGKKKTSVLPIHVCVHSLRDNGCSPSDIEIASVRLTYLSVDEEARRVRGSLLGRVKHKSISLHSTTSREEATTGLSILNARMRGERSHLVCISMYHDSGVGNSRFIRRYLLDSRYQWPHPVPPCRIGARGNKISRE